MARRLTAACTVAVALLAACGDPGDRSEPAGSGTSTVSTPPATDAPPTTELPPLVLRGDALGTHEFGEAADALLDDLTARFGAADTDEARAYSTARGDGGYLTDDGAYHFVAPFGREVCWLFGLCVELGGDTSNALSFRGWTYGGDATGTLASPTGVTVGSRWMDHPEMRVQPGGCYAVGGGTVDGIVLVLESSRTLFGDIDENGNYTAQLPEPDEVTVLSMHAGAYPELLFGDC